MLPLKQLKMTVTTTPMLPTCMNVSSAENHKKIAAFLEATAKHLEPIEYAETVEGQSANIFQSKVSYVSSQTSKAEGIV